MRVQIQEQQNVRESGEPRALINQPNFGDPAIVEKALMRAGGDLQQVGNIGLKYAQQKQHEEDTATAMDIYNKMSQWKVETLNGSEGIYSLEGSNAIGSAERYATLYKKQMGEVTKGISQSALNYANKLTVRDHSNTLNQLSTFEAKQIKAFKDASSGAMINGAINNAIGFANDPEAMDGSFAEIRTGIDTLYAGQPKEFRDLKMLEATTQVHNNVLDDFVDRDPDLAKQYMEDHADEISEASKIVNQKKIDKSSILKKAQGIADSIDYSTTPKTDALNYVRENYDGDERKDAISLIKTRYAEKDEAERVDYEQAYNNVLAVINDGGTVKPSEWTALNERDENSLLRYKLGLTEGKVIKTEPKTWKSLYEMQQNNPDNFKKVNLNQYINSLSTSDFQDFVKAQNDVRNGEVGFALTSLFGPATEAKNYLKNAGFDVDSDDGILFMRQAQKMISDFETQIGKKSTPEDRTKVFDHLMMEVEIDNGTFLGLNWNNPDRRIFQVGEGEAIIPPDFDDIPTSEKEMIIQSLQSRGFEVTPEMIIQTYGAKLNARK